MTIIRTLPRRLPNAAYRQREYLTETEVERLIDAARKRGRNSARDAAAILLAYRHGLRARTLPATLGSGRSGAMGVCTLIAPRAGLRASIPCMGQSYERCAHCRAQASTCSPHRLALRSLQLGSCGWFSVQGALQSFPSLCTHTCSGMLADTSSRTMATTRVRWRTISGIATFNQPRVIPLLRLIGLRGSGMIDRVSSSAGWRKVSMGGHPTPVLIMTRGTLAMAEASVLPLTPSVKLGYSASRAYSSTKGLIVRQKVVHRCEEL
jgi:hypothetical protein